MNHRRPHWPRMAVAAIVAIIVAQVGIAAYAVASNTTEQEPNVPIVPSQPIDAVLDLEQAAALGLEIARQWRSDSVLVDAGMQVDWPDESIADVPSELPRGGWALLRYLSGHEMLTLRVDRGSGVVVETELIRLSAADAAQLAARALDFQQASTTSSTAILATEAAYGLTYRAACPDRRRATWISAETDGSSGQRSWYVAYRDNDDRERITLSVRIDWASGDIFDGVNLNPNCAD